MTATLRWIGACGLAFLAGLSWHAQLERPIAAAQTAGGSVVMKRIYTGTDGQSHVEDIVLDAKSLMEKVTSVEVRVSPPGRFSDWHVGPQRQYIINLAGNGRLGVAEGMVDLPPGSIEFIDDLTGKGHTTASTGSQERVSVWLKFEDQTQRIGPLRPAAR